MAMSKKFLKGSLFGLAAGAIGGILFAPKSGEQTRQDIKRRARELKDDTVDKYDTIKDKTEEKAGDLKDNVRAKVGAVRRRGARLLSDDED